MSLKLIVVPLVGVAGVIVGAIGTANSASRSIESADTTPPHSWIPQPIDSIELSFKCSKDEYDLFGGGRRNYYTFKVLSKVGGTDLDLLVKDGKVNVSTKVKFEAEGGWDELINFTRDPANETSLVVNYNDEETLNVVLKGSGSRRDEVSEIKFFCIRGSGAKQMSWLGRSMTDKQVYSSKVISSDSTVLESRKNEVNEIMVEMANCLQDMQEKTSSCDLRLTDKEGLKWRVNVSEKLRLTFS